MRTVRAQDGPGLTRVPNSCDVLRSPFEQRRQRFRVSLRFLDRQRQRGDDLCRGSHTLKRLGFKTRKLAEYRHVPFSME